ncbi:RDD family protein [Streptomyces sp. NPDC057654]|uniref:RDD family protein n=1 Tax=Streptomyces sp. NPDC057654 TaxID=3346196 RepID=UPI0036BEAB58
MSASTSGSADGSPTPGFYPDPSIPGYIRYWNGVAWVPGTSRPAPKDGEAMPAAPAGAAPPTLAPPAASSAVRADEAGRVETRPETAHAEGAGSGRAEGGRAESGRAESGRAESGRAESGRGDSSRAVAVTLPEETGPMFLDEEPEPLSRTAAADVRSEPAAVWPSDTSRRGGLGGSGGSGGEQDRRTPWGSDEPGADGRPEAGAREAVAYAPAAVVWPSPADSTEAAPQAPVPVQGGGHAAMPPVHAAEPGAEPWAAPSGGAMAGYGRGTDVPEARVQPAPVGRPHQSSQPGHPDGQGQQGPQSVQPPQGFVPAQGGGAPAWSQQPAHAEGAHAGAYGPAAPSAPAGPAAPAEGVIPWKPPVDNPFLQAAQAQGKPAPLGRRLGARLIDTVVLGAVVAAAAVPLWAKAADHIDGKVEGAKQSGETVTVWLLDGTTGAYLGIVLAVLLLAGVVYEALPTAKWGRTLGKKLCGVRVLGIEDHDKPSFGAALRRWLMYGVLGLLAVGVLNVLWCLFDRPWRQCWHDKAAHTFVARAR